MKPLKSIFAATAAAALVAAAPAAAQAPVPDSCIGTAITDPAGDAINGLGAGTPELGDVSPAVDVTSVFFTQKGGKPYANIQVADLSMDITQPWFSHWYMVMFKAGDATIHRLDAIVDLRGTPIFTYGVDPTEDTDVGTSYRGDTTGTFHEGPNGVIEIEIPAEAMGIAGKTITAPSVEVRVSTRPAAVTPGPVAARWVGPIADDGAGKGGFNVTGACVPPAPEAVEGAPVETPAAPPAAAPAPAPAAPAPAKPAAKKPSCAAKAKKIKNKRKRAAALKRCKKAAKRR